MARVNKTRYAILGCLSLKPMSAYEIKQFIHKSIALFWTESEGQLYPSLKKLHAEGLVSYTEEQAQKSGIRKIYSITDLGEKMLLCWLQETADRTVYRNELLLKLFFGTMQSTENNRKLLEAEKSEAIEMLELYKVFKDTLAKKEIPTERKKFIKMCLNYGIEIKKAELKWCEDSLTELK